jgi:hypothetical protein
VPTDQLTPTVPPPVRQLTDAVFRTASSLRNARVFHPDGVVLRGELQVVDDGLAGTELFAPGRRATAVVRLSRGIGLPERFPDVLGLAVKVPDAYGPGADQDLLLASTPPPAPLRRFLAPSPSFDALPYSSLLPYRAGDARVLLGAVVAAEGEAVVTMADAVNAAAERRLRIELVSGGRLGSYTPFATIEPYDVLPVAQGEHLAFDPWHTGGGLRPVGLLNRLRAAAYPGSRRGRP